MWQKVKKFLEEQGVAKDPLLLGFSGGVDSTALLFLLKKCRAHVHVLHIDHRWRKNSQEEAYSLKKQVEALGFPFYMETIQGINPENDRNLEERYREKRFLIFQRYYQELKVSALLLAHQKDDQAETIFKRIFEGASLGKVIGLKEVSYLHGMKILKPLLEITKKQLYAWAEGEGLTWIEDETNKQIQYLRARQREKIFPQIEKTFGKGAVHNLCRFHHQLKRYSSYMDKRTQRYQAALLQDPRGSYLDLNALDPWEEIELEYFIRKRCEELASPISHEALETLLLKLQDSHAPKKVLLKHITLLSERGRLFFLHNELLASKNL